MKRMLSMLIAVILVLSMIPAAATAAQPITVYVDPQKGSNANSGTEDSPVQNFTRAYELLQNGGGTVVMLSTVSTMLRTKYILVSIITNISAAPMPTALSVLMITCLSTRRRLVT